MDAINSLVGGTRQAQAMFDGAARRIAGADLPTAKNPDPTDPVNPDPAAAHDVDVAGQLTTMTVAADMHHVTTAALRSAFSLYRDSIDLLRSSPNRDT